MLLKEISKSANVNSLVSDIDKNHKLWFPLDKAKKDEKYKKMDAMTELVTNTVNKYFDEYGMETDMDLVHEFWDTIIDKVSEKMIKKL